MLDKMETIIFELIDEIERGCVQCDYVVYNELLKLRDLNEQVSRLVQKL